MQAPAFQQQWAQRFGRRQQQDAPLVCAAQRDPALSNIQRATLAAIIRQGSVSGPRHRQWRVRPGYLGRLIGRGSADVWPALRALEAAGWLHLTPVVDGDFLDIRLTVPERFEEMLRAVAMTIENSNTRPEAG